MTRATDPKPIRSVNPENGAVSYKLPNDDLHRVDGPASFHPYDGRTSWWLFGQRHRDGGPAVYGPDLAEEWYQHGKYHRDDGPAVIYPIGQVEYHRHGKLHRIDGPAIETPGSALKRYWAVDGTRIADSGVLDLLYSSGSADDLRVLELILTAWAPGGPSVSELRDAVVHAHA